jgi:hypothetical protein
MKKKFKLWLLVPALFIGSFYFTDRALAEEQEPQVLYFYDTELGTDSYELLITYSNGGHSTIGQVLKDAGVAEEAPGIGFGVGSGGNGYRPNVAIYIWTDQTLDLTAARSAIKSFVNVPANPETTNGDCAISCDGTYQEEEPVESTTTTVVSTTTTVVIQEPQPEPQSNPEPAFSPEPVVVPTTTTTTTTTLPVVENYNSDTEISPTPFYITAQPSTGVKTISSLPKKTIVKKPIIKKKVVIKKVPAKVQSKLK